MKLTNLPTLRRFGRRGFFRVGALFGRCRAFESVGVTYPAKRENAKQGQNSAKEKQPRRTALKSARALLNERHRAFCVDDRDATRGANEVFRLSELCLKPGHQIVREIFEIFLSDSTDEECAFDGDALADVPVPFRIVILSCRSAFWPSASDRYAGSLCASSYSPGG